MPYDVSCFCDNSLHVVFLTTKTFLLFDMLYDINASTVILCMLFFMLQCHVMLQYFNVYLCIMTWCDVDVESCVLFVSMLHYRPRLLLGFVDFYVALQVEVVGGFCWFLCCTTGRGCWWVLLFVCSILVFSPLFPTSALYWYPQTVCARYVFKEIVKDYLIF